jgi:hypothetical protein
MAHLHLWQDLMAPAPRHVILLDHKCHPFPRLLWSVKRCGRQHDVWQRIRLLLPFGIWASLEFDKWKFASASEHVVDRPKQSLNGIYTGSTKKEE